MRENRDFVVPVNILTPFAHAPFSWAARHTTVCLDIKVLCFDERLTRKVSQATVCMQFYIIMFDKINVNIQE